jgi:phosphopantothenate-cysteine ligase
MKDARILITSGGTKVAIDRVRHVGNMSRGTFGAKIAQAFLKSSNLSELLFLKAKGSRSPFQVNINWAGGWASAVTGLDEADRLCELYQRNSSRYYEWDYKDFQDYLVKIKEAVDKDPWDLVILAAAVSDFTVANYVDGKIRSKDELSIQLTPAPKIISLIKQWRPSVKLVGFKLLVDSTDEQLIEAAQKSAVENDCAFVVANDLRDIQQGKHRLLLVNKDGCFKRSETDPSNPNHLAEVVAQTALEL